MRRSRRSRAGRRVKSANSASSHQRHDRTRGSVDVATRRTVTTHPPTAATTKTATYAALERTPAQPAANVARAKTSAPVPMRFNTTSARSAVTGTGASTSDPAPSHAMMVATASEPWAMQSSTCDSHELDGVEPEAGKHPEHRNQVHARPARRMLPAARRRPGAGFALRGRLPQRFTSGSARTELCRCPMDRLPKRSVLVQATIVVRSRPTTTKPPTASPQRTNSNLL